MRKDVVRRRTLVPPPQGVDEHAASRVVVVPTGCTRRVKTAISVPDALFHRAERVAQQRGRTRSALYAEALEAYLDAAEDMDEVTAALDVLYADAVASVPRESGAGAGRRLIDSGRWEW